MGWYTATKPFTRKLGDAVIRHKRGDRVFIDFREEAESLLREKSVVKGKQKLKPLAEEETAPNQDAEFKGIVRELAKEAGLGYEACHAKVKKYTQPDQKTGKAMPLEEAVLRLRNDLSLLEDIEKIELLALDMGVEEAQANEQVAIAMERYECSIDEAVAKVRYGLELQNEPLAEGEVELNGRVFETGKTRVRVDETDPNHAGRTGTVTAITEGGVVHVSLDGDEADYREIDDNRLVVIEEEESDEAKEKQPEDEADKEPEIAEGVRVMAEYKGEIRYGTIVKASEAEVRVKLDGDDADYRRLSRDDIDIAEEE